MKKITWKIGSSFVQDRRGAVAVMVALGMTMLVGVTGLAIDVGSYYMLQIQLQNSADSAALSAATLLGGDVDDLRDRAKVYATKNMTVAAHGKILVNGDITPGNWNTATNAFTAGGAPENAIRVRTRRAAVNGNAAQSYFLSLFGVSSIDIVTEAIATKEGYPHCMVALSDTASGALDVSSNATVAANGCSIKVNSSSNSGFKADSNAIVTAESVCVAGGANVQGGATVTPTPEENCSKSFDPMAGFVPPSIIGGCDHNNYSKGGNGTYTLTPGRYCGGLEMSSNTTANLNPGNYFIDGGDLDISSNAAVNGTGVTFFLTNGAKFRFSSNTIVDLSAPTTGSMAGIIIYQDPADIPGGLHEFSSNTVGKLEGMIYLPNATLELSSNSTVGDTAAYLMILADKIELSSNTNLVLNSDYSSIGGSPLSNLLSVAQLRR